MLRERVEEAHVCLNPHILREPIWRTNLFTSGQAVHRSKKRPLRLTVGILFIHGIGAQRRRQLFAEFGRPIYFWLQDRFRGIDRRWREAIRAHSDEALLEKWRGKVEDWANEGFKEEDTAQHNWPDLPCEKLEQLAKSVRSETVVSRAVLTDAVINDPEDPTAPAHAELRLQWQRNVRGPVRN